jgi:hypothetical protein
VPPYFFHKGIIPKELSKTFVQAYHSKEFNERLIKAAKYVIETQPNSRPRPSAQLGWAKFEHVLFYSSSKCIRSKGEKIPAE